MSTATASLPADSYTRKGDGPDEGRHPKLSATSSNPKIKELQTEDNTGVDDEDEDEKIQDWAEIAKLTQANAPVVIPKRGEKDYEPDGSNIQELLLYRARKAMFDTLTNSVRGSTVKSQVKAYYVPEKHMAYVPHAKGNFTQTMGTSTSVSGELWLEFYEFVYLSERGTVTPYWQVELDKSLDIPLSMEDLYSLFQSQEELDNFSVYAHLKRLGFIVIKAHFPDESGTAATTFFEPAILRDMVARRNQNYLSSMFSLTRLTSSFLSAKNSFFNGIFYCRWHYYFRRYTSSQQLYQQLNKLVPYYCSPKTREELHSTAVEGLSCNGNERFSYPVIAFNIWKPTPNFKKKSAELPDYQVVVYNKSMTGRHFPTYREFRRIFNSLDYKFEFLNTGSSKPFSKQEFWDRNSFIDGVSRAEYLDNLKARKHKRSAGQATGEQTTGTINTAPGSTGSGGTPKNQTNSLSYGQKIRSLRNGYRSFLLAVVDNGIISFVKISEADFGSTDVWYDGQRNVRGKRRGGKP